MGTLTADEEALANRLRQAATGCTIHLHGPVNALAAILDADVDRGAVLDEVIARSRARAERVDGADAERELKVVGVLEVFRRGLP